MSDKLSEELREKIAKALGMPFVPIDPEEEKRRKERLTKKLTEVFGVKPIHLEGAGDLFSTIAVGTELRARRAEEQAQEAAGIKLDVWDDPPHEWTDAVEFPPLIHVIYPLPDLSDLEIYP